MLVISGSLQVLSCYVPDISSSVSEMSTSFSHQNVLFISINFSLFV